MHAETGVVSKWGVNDNAGRRMTVSIGGGLESKEVNDGQ